MRPFACALLLAVVTGCAPRSQGEAATRQGPASSAAAASITASPSRPPGGDGDASAVHGTLRELGGQRVLHVWGTPREMGFAHGYLLQGEILRVIDGYVLGAIPPATFAALGPLHGAAAEVTPALREEAAGLVAGMEAAGGAHVDGLGRALEVTDILLMNSITDLVAIGCSSVSAWGPSTTADEALAGELAIVRNLDWTASEALLRSQVIVAYEPSEAGAQRLVSVAFAGYLGCLSCVNEAGVGVFFNMGHGEGAASRTEAARGFAPANLLLRAAVGAADLDGDGASTTDDVARALADHRHAGSYIVHAVEPATRAIAAGRAPARVLEVEARGVGERGADATSPLGASVLAATNHLRELAPARACSRYRRIEREVEAAAAALSERSLWELGESLRIEGDVVHTLLVVPGSRRIGVRMRAPGRSMADSPSRIDHAWSALFEERG